MGDIRGNNDIEIPGKLVRYSILTAIVRNRVISFVDLKAILTLFHAPLVVFFKKGL